MKPLHVALVHRDSPRAKQERMVGIWSASVPEFTWEHFDVEKKFKLNRDDFTDFNLIFYEDGKLAGKWSGSKVPIAYHVVDSTLSDEHYQIRRAQAAQVDLVLLCHENLDRFRYEGGPAVRRLSHCINTRFFKDWGEEKTVDVSFHNRTKGDWFRAELQDWLANHCRGRQWTYACGTRLNEEYGKAFNRSKVTVNWSRQALNRPHRVFDAMGCRTCLLSRTLPDVSGEATEEGVHYVAWNDYAELANRLDDLLMPEHDLWRDIGDVGYTYVHTEHTWPVRAKQLRQILREELGL